MRAQQASEIGDRALRIARDILIRRVSGSGAARGWPNADGPSHDDACRGAWSDAPAEWRAAEAGRPGPRPAADIPVKEYLQGA